MHVALLHSFYESADSGENAYVLALEKGLRDAGVRVSSVFRWPPHRRLRSGLNVAPGPVGSPTAELRQLRPDVVHVHNLVPGFNSDWFSQCPAPVVATVHNYRSTCIAGTFIRDGRPCFLCAEKPSLTAAVGGRCYRASRAQSLLLVTSLLRSHGYADVVRRAAALVVPSETARQAMVRAGFDASLMSIIPHFVDVPAARLDAAREGFVFVGRLSPEKGLASLLVDWPEDQPLRILGDGPQRSTLSALAERRGLAISFEGRQPRPAVLDALATACALVFPSIAPETFGLTYAEALAQGTPTVARANNSVARMIENDGYGWVYEDAAGLVQGLQSAAGGTHEPPSIRAVYEQQYTPDAHIARLLQVYERIKAPRA